MEKLIISVTVGYMLKVLKSEKEIVSYREEFNAIRHGDYIKFINLVKGPIPFMVMYNAGTITSGHLPPIETDIDFALLLKAGPSLKIFFDNCLSTYGRIEDADITNEIYEKLAVFEINLRMHASNNKLTTVNDKLVVVIDRLGAYKNIPTVEIAKIHEGRRFLNMVKHNRNQFTSWTEGIAALKNAEEILEKYQLTA